MKNSFYLVTPEQQSNAELLAFYEKEAVTEWLLSLPTTSPVFAAQLLCNFIKKFNATEMPVQQRLDIAELLRPHFIKLKQSLYVLLSRFGFPKSESDQKAFALLISLEKNFTVAYWLMVGELTRRRVSWAQGKNVALALQRTIKGLSGIVVSHYMMYLPVPDWVWFDLHSLYKLSLTLKKSSIKVVDETSLSSKGLCPEEAYIQILLFSLTQPNGLMQREVDQVNHLINTLSRWVKVSKGPIKDQDIQCIIFIDEDKAPFLIPSYTSRRSVPTFFLNFTQLYKVLNQFDKLSDPQQFRFEALGFAKRRSEKMSRELLNYIINQWNNTPEENPSLFSDRLDRVITVGLTHTYLSQTSDDNIKKGVLTTSFSERALVSSSLTEGLISIGSLVGFTKTDSPKDKPYLGIVKKITMPKLRGEIIFELTLLSRQAYAVNYVNESSSVKSEGQKALLYRKKNKSKEKTYILIEFYTYNTGDVIRLFFDDKDFNVVLGSKKCVGLGYWQFECRRVEKKKNYQKQRKTKLILNYIFKAK